MFNVDGHCNTNSPEFPLRRFSSSTQALNSPKHAQSQGAAASGSVLGHSIADSPKASFPKMVTENSCPTSSGTHCRLLGL